MAENNTNKNRTASTQTTTRRTGAEPKRTQSTTTGANTNKINSAQNAKKVQPRPAAQGVGGSQRKGTPTGQNANNRTNGMTNKQNTAGNKNVKPTNPKSKMPKGKKVKTKGKVRVVLRSFMIVLMIAYAVAVGIIGWWGFDNFFAFYFAEKSPVMGVGTESSRVDGIDTISDADIKKGEDLILNNIEQVDKVTVRQVGPTIHFYVEVPTDTDIGVARTVGQNVITTFADGLEQPEMFATYEAQIIVTKSDLTDLTDEEHADTLLREADQDGAEQHFPQYGVSNKYTDGANKGISWSRNGE